MEMEPTTEATYERARRFANNAMWSIALQCRRLQSEEPEDNDFVMRQWADFHFLIVALIRLRRSAMLVQKVPAIKKFISIAIRDFDSVLPGLKTMRDIEEHIDEYAIDKGRNRNISRKSLEVSILDGVKLIWLGHTLDAIEAMQAGQKLFDSIKKSKQLLKVTPKNSNPVI